MCNLRAEINSDTEEFLGGDGPSNKDEARVLAATTTITFVVVDHVELGSNLEPPFEGRRGRSEGKSVAPGVAVENFFHGSGIDHIELELGETGPFDRRGLVSVVPNTGAGWNGNNRDRRSLGRSRR